jgi:NADH:quinone reductase (non-electrogenic)
VELAMVAGLIHDIPTVAELIERIMANAERLTRNRLMALLGTTALAEKVA